MKSQAYLLATLLAILIMASIIVITKPLYVESGLKASYNTLIHSQRDTNWQVLYILLGIESIVSQDEGYWKEIGDGIKDNNPDTGTRIDTYASTPYITKAWNVLNTILNHMNLINDTYNKPLIKQGVLENISSSSNIYVSDKVEYTDDPFVDGVAYAIGVRTIDSKNVYKVERTVDIISFKIDSGSLAIEDAYVYIVFTNTYSFYINGSVVLSYRSIIIKNITIKVNGLEPLPENKYKIYMEPDSGLVNMTIGISISRLLSEGELYLYIEVATGHNDIIRVLVDLTT